MDSCREVESERRERVRCRPSEVVLSLVFQTREVTLEASQRPSGYGKNNTFPDCTDSPRSSVMQPNSILDVQVCAPVTDLRCALELGQLKNRIIIAVVNRDRFLLLVHEIRGCGRRYVMEGAVSQSRARLRHHCVRSKLDILRCSVRVDLRARRPTRRYWYFFLWTNPRQEHT